MNEKSTEIATAYELGQLSNKAEFAHPAGRPYLFGPNTAHIFDLERFLPAPVGRTATVVTLTVASFIEYVKAYRTGSCRIWSMLADAPVVAKAQVPLAQTDRTKAIAPQPGEVMAIMDYHGVGLTGSSSWCTHRLHLVLRHTPEWIAWCGIHGQWISQEDLALFIEEWAYCVEVPEPANMLEVSRTMEATSGFTFRSSLRLENGDVQFQHDTTTKASAGEKDHPLEIPTRLQLQLAVYQGEPHLPVDCRFRYRLDTKTGALSYQIQLVRPHELLRRLHESIENRIATDLNGCEFTRGMVTALPQRG